MASNCLSYSRSLVVIDQLVRVVRQSSQAMPQLAGGSGTSWDRSDLERGSGGDDLSQFDWIRS